MRTTKFLSRSQIETVHRNALRVLSEVGVQVEHEDLRARLAAAYGCAASGSRLHFAPAAVERALPIGETPKLEDSHPRLTVFSGIYQSCYLDPVNGELMPFDEDRLARYIALANSLPLVSWLRLLGLPYVPHDIPADYLPLAEKLYAWKFGAKPFGSVQNTLLCEQILEMFSCHAALSGKRLEEVFSAVGFLISPLRLARPECEQLLFFADRGLRMDIGHLPSQGGTVPVTFAGALTLALAEQIFLYLLQRALYERAVFRVGEAIMTVDMRTGASLYGRPEKERANAAFADIARFYGCECLVHTGCTDAKKPSFEAGAQKATSALMTALAAGEGAIEAGMLGIDEICSPIQMILDHDLAASLTALLSQPVVTDEECAVDDILQNAASGTFLNSDLTARRCRTEFFRPRTWSNQSLAQWKSSGTKTDIDFARSVYERWEKSFVPHQMISAEEERELRGIISAAVRRSAASA